MSAPLKPQTAQHLLLAGLVGVMAVSALLLWLLRSRGERGARPSGYEGSGNASGALLTAAPDRAPAEPLSIPPLASSPRIAIASALEPSVKEELVFDPGVIAGRVVRQGQPVPGVELRLFQGWLEGWPERRERATPLAQTQSDAEGRFRFPGRVPHERYALHLQHPDYLPQEEALYPGHTEELELEPSATVRGTVRAVENGQPLAGVEIALERWHFGPTGSAERLSAVSDAEGHWQLAWVKPGIERFSIVRPGRLPESREFQVALEGGDGFEILLGSAAALELELVALESGAPLADTELLCDEMRVRSDGRGHLVVPLAPSAAGTESVRLSLALEGGCWTQGRVNPTAVHGFVRVPLARGGTVHGRVVDADGTPVNAAHLRLTGGGRLPSGLALPEGFWLNPPRDPARSGPDGSFTLAGLPPREGQVEVRAQHPKHPPGRSMPFGFARLGQTVELEIRLERGATIAGTVRLDGEPAALPVYWSAARANGWTRSNDQGDYRIVGVPSGEVSLCARLADEDEDVPRAEDQTLAVDEGASLVVDFDLDGNRAPIRGRVADTRGAPVIAAEIVATLSEEGSAAGQDEPWDEPRTASASDGTFELFVPDRPGLSFDLWAESGPRQAVVHAVRPGDEQVAFVLPALTPVSLRVVDALHHDPVLGFQVYWRETDEGRYEHLVQGGRRFSPGPDGTFLAELPAGRLDLLVSAHAQGFVPARHAAVDLLGAGPGRLDFELERGVELELEIHLPPEAGNLLQQLQRGRTAVASDEQWSERERGGAYFQQEVRNAQSLRLDGSGVARLEGLASGRYRFFNGPKGFRFRPQEFELPPVAHHRLSVSLEPEQRPKPEGARD